MKITTNKKDLEFVCDEVDYSEGVKVGKQLHKICLATPDITGLAHNQIRGSKRVFVAYVGKGGYNGWRTFINPKIIRTSEEVFKHQERCMSFPKKKHTNKVLRNTWITLKYQVGEYQWIDECFDGFNGCVIQHEMDHLNGVHIFNNIKTIFSR